MGGSSITLFTIAAFVTMRPDPTNAQVPPWGFEATPDPMAMCGFTPEYMIAQSTSPERESNGTLQLDFPPGLIEQCGYYRLYFEDLVIGAGQGFDAGGGIGATRRATACAVFTYLSSVIAAPPPGQFIDIHFRESASLGGTALAVAGPFLQPPTLGTIWDSGGPTNGGITAGYAYDHLTTGVDPQVDEYDGHIQVDFVSFQFVNDAATNLVFCDTYDLFSVILHEAMHVLGWFSMIVENGGSPVSHNQLSLAPFNAPVFSKYDDTFLFHGISGRADRSRSCWMCNPSSPSPSRYTARRRV